MPFIFLVAMAVGGAYAAIAGVLKVTRGVNEVVSTIMLNFIATGIIAFLLTGTSATRTSQPQSRDQAAPRVGPAPALNRLLEGSATTSRAARCIRASSFAIAHRHRLLRVVYRTRFGFDLRTTGANPAAALPAGVNPKR